MSFKELFLRCESSTCPYRGRAWRALFRKPKSIRLQGRLLCSLECFESAVEELFTRLLPAVSPRQLKNHRVPLGLLLLSQGLITNDKLKAALKAQRESGTGRLGAWLQRLGAATEQQITSALGIQWSCPVFPLENHRGFLECIDMVPFPLLETYQMIPVHYLPTSHLLYVAFSEGIDHTALYAIEQTLRCRTEPCLADQTSLERVLREIRDRPRPSEILLEGTRNIPEMARQARGYAGKLDAKEVRITGCGEYFWVRLTGSRQASNLLFHVFSGASK